MTQSTLATFSQPAEAENCTTCTVLHTIIGDRCRCVFAAGKRIPDCCKNYWPADPLRYWPPLAPNYETPKKWRGGR